MKIQEEYLKYLNENDQEDKDVKIHPKRKVGMSFAAIGPFDDLAFAGLGVSAPIIAKKLPPKLVNSIKSTTDKINDNKIIKSIKSTKRKIGEKITPEVVKKFSSTKVGKITMDAVGGVIAGAVAVAGYRLIRSFFDRCTKECGILSVNTPKRQLCLLNCKKLTLEKKIVLMKKNKKDPTETIKRLNIVNKKIILYNEYLKKNPPKAEKKKG